MDGVVRLTWMEVCDLHRGVKLTWRSVTNMSVASHAESIIVLKDWRDLYTVNK